MTDATTKTEGSYTVSVQA